VGEATFCAALDAAVPQWREQREYPSLFAAFLRDGARTRRERIEDVVASALGRVLDPAASLAEVLDVRVDRVYVRTVIETVLRATLAYDTAWVDASAAERVADSFVASFGPRSALLDEWVSVAQERRLPRVDAPHLRDIRYGVVGVDREVAGILWVADEE